MANDDLIRREDVARILTDPAFPYEPQIERAVLDLPAVDAVPIVHAEWVKENDRVNHWHCSNCDNAFGQVVYFYKFCPFCGASMTVKDQTNL